MFKVKKQQRATLSRPSVKPGIYHSIIIDIKAASNYVAGHAFIFVYELTDANGKKFPFQETFVNPDVSKYHPRAEALMDIMDIYGIDCIDNLSALIGKKEILRLMKAVVGDHSYINIIERKPDVTDNE